MDTRWSSAYAASSSWLQVDLGSEKSVGKVDANWGTDRASSYELRVSDDGSSWTTVATVATSAAGVKSTVLSSPVRARYVRVVELARVSATDKIDVYGLKVF